MEEIDLVDLIEQITRWIYENADLTNDQYALVCEVMSAAALRREKLARESNT